MVSHQVDNALIFHFYWFGFQKKYIHHSPFTIKTALSFFQDVSNCEFFTVYRTTIHYERNPSLHLEVLQLKLLQGYSFNFLIGSVNF